ncbi:MAG TPA: carbohydrate ABC transporter permease [Actinomycetes bacterium]|nr:carbohydrate ABC transporter permease [Actinomycetes bacterium]
MTAVDLPVAVPAPVRAPQSRRGRHRQLLVFIAEHAIAIAVALMFLAPFVFIALTAVMTNTQALTANLWPTSWQFDNFVEVFRAAPMLRYATNSLIYSVLATGFMLLSSIPAAYALARLRWRGRNLAFMAVLVMMMLPPQVTVVPMYILWARWELTGTLWPLILPNLLGDAFSIFLIRQFLLTIPEEYADAARCDGCSELRVMLQIILPLAKPAIAAAALFMFFLTWNDYFGPLLYTGENANNWTLALGLANFKDLHRVQWNLTMAATLVVMVPVIVLFFFAQKAFVRGIALTGGVTG